MNSKEQQDSEATEIYNKFKTLYDFCKIGNNRTQFISDYLFKFSTQLNQVITAIQPISFTPNIKSGKKGEERTSDNVYDQYSHLTQVNKCVYEEFTNVLEFLDSNAISLLKTQYIKNKGSLKELKLKVKNAKKERNDASLCFIKEKKNYEKLTNDVNKAYIKYQDGKFGKMEQKLNDALIQVSIHYRDSLRACGNAVKNMNDKHSQFMNLVRNSIIEMKKIEIQRTASLHSILTSCHQIFKEILIEAENSTNFLSSFKPDWEKHFRQYTYNNCITRTSLGFTPFQYISVDLQDEKVDIKKDDKVGFDLDMPLYIGECLKDFNGIDKYEMSVISRQQVLVYETLKQDWCYCTTLDKSKSGYLPSENIKILDYDLAFVTSSSFGDSLDYLSVSTGDILVINEIKGNIASCTNMQQKKGIVDVSLLCIYKKN